MRECCQASPLGSQSRVKKGSSSSRRTHAKTIPVTADNFIRAETDLYFGNVVKDGGFGHFFHNREPTPIDHQLVIRQNRDTLYLSPQSTLLVARFPAAP